MRQFLTTILFFILCGVEAQQSEKYIKINELPSDELPFREVLHSLEDKLSNKWLLVTNHLCRFDGIDNDCFEIPMVGLDQMMLIDERYLVLYSSTKSKSIIFDTEQFVFRQLPITTEYRIVKNLKPKKNLLFVTKHSIFSYDINTSKVQFIQDNLDSITFKHVYFRTSKDDIILLNQDNIISESARHCLSSNIALYYMNAIELSKEVIFSNGKDIYTYSMKNGDVKLLYTDERICKKIWNTNNDTTFLVAWNEFGQCRYVEKLVEKTIAFQTVKDFTSLIDQRNYAGTLAHIYINNRNEINFSTFLGYYSYAAGEKNISKLFDQNPRPKDFSRAIRGITKDNHNNLIASKEVSSLLIQNSDGRQQLLDLQIHIGQKLQDLQFSRDLIYDEINDLIYGVSGYYDKEGSTLYSWSSSSQKVRGEYPLNFRVYKIVKHDRKLFFGTGHNVVYSFDLDTKKVNETLTLMKMPDEAIKSMIWHNKTLYLGTESSILSHDFNANHTRKVLHEDDIDVKTMYVKNDKLYACSSKGLFIYDIKKDKLKKYNSENGLSDNTVSSAFPLDNGTIIVGTNNGINLLTQEPGLISVLKSPQFEISDNEFNYSSTYEDSDNLYLGTINGVTTIKKKAFSSNMSSTPYVSKFVVHSNKKEPFINYQHLREIQFKPEDQKIDLYYTTSTKSKYTKYAIKMEKDSSWTTLKENSYDLIRPIMTRSKMFVKCTDENGVWSTKHVTYIIQVHDYFYRKTWFYVLLTCIITFGIYLFSRWRLNEIKKHEHRITEMNQKISEVKLYALQSQMNPHFLFNAMASIQYQLQRKDTERAEDLLAKFGKMIRMILDSSKVKTWTVDEEVKLLKLYCNIEKERFDDGQVEVLIDIDDINLQRKIPPMIIQPFVENVFNHAFVKNKNRKGLLHITFYEQGDRLLVEIQDNGIGIYHSKSKIRAQRENLPRGMEITKERIELFSRESGSEILLHISEVNSLQEFAGTVVKISFPHI